MSEVKPGELVECIKSLSIDGVMKYVNGAKYKVGPYEKAAGTCWIDFKENEGHLLTEGAFNEYFKLCMPSVSIEVEDDISRLLFEEEDNWTCLFSLIAAQTKEIKELKSMIKEMGGK